MSLYYDAASILSASGQQGSLKSRIYAKDSTLKSKPAHVYALMSETAKYDTFLKEVIDNAELLHHEPKVTPLLALLLLHDHFFAKGGIAAAASHPLRLSIERHKARLQSEFTKARLKRRIATVDQLKIDLLTEKGSIGRVHPRWVRVNTLKSNIDSLWKEEFSGYQQAEHVESIVTAGKESKILYVDKHVPNLMAFPPQADLTKLQPYMDGKIILQDKASCFPAHLLLGNEASGDIRDMVDGCAAPGNKTTHLAAIASSVGSQSDIFACERDSARSKTLQMMVDRAGTAKLTTVLATQDFLALDVHDSRFQNVTHLLLDPSCSGSGIVGREDIPKLALPIDPRQKNTNSGTQSTSNARKRKRDKPPSKSTGDGRNLDANGIVELENDVDPNIEQQPLAATNERLEKLSNLQSRIIEHAFTFPAARRVTYSTCSIYTQENEAVVFRVLNSQAGKKHGWRVLRRNEQVEGMSTWKHRGMSSEDGLTHEQREACIRCTPDDGEGTMGFFVCGFVKDGSNKDESGSEQSPRNDDNVEGNDEWQGFSDSR